jgi:hypothetical protein
VQLLLVFINMAVVVLTPKQLPTQPTKAAPEFGVAVNVTVEFAANADVQVPEEHCMPEGVDVTEPAPEMLTVKAESMIGQTCGVAENEYTAQSDNISDR